MLVHSFSLENMWFGEDLRCAALFGIEAEKDMVYPAQPFDGLVLNPGWVKGDLAYFEK